MTLHYHGTDMPHPVLYALSGRCLFVSFLGTRKRDIEIAHAIAQSVGIDNGAYPAWRSGAQPDWEEFYRWVAPWLAFHTTWAVIPDVIDGDEAANDALIEAWPHGPRGAPVWHLHEPIPRLVRLAGRWPRVCLGSSGQYATIGSARWHGRMTEAMNVLCGSGPPPCWLHMLRGMALAGSTYPFSSVDSSDIARNYHRPQNDAAAMAARWDALQCPAVWTVRPTQYDLTEIAS